MPQFEQLDTFISQAFWFVVFFLIMYLVLNFYIIPKLNSVVIKRSNRVTRYLEQAAASRSETEALNHQTIEIISEAKRQAQVSLNAARAQIRDNEAKRISETEENINNKMKSFDADIQKIRKKLLTQVDNEAEILSKKIINHIKAN